jgi:hypothetical protein
MWLSRSSSLALLAAASLGAQTAPPARIEFTAPLRTVACARKIQIIPRAVSLFGTTMVRPFALRSLDPAIATVDGNGVVSGLAPGLVDIEAQDQLSGISGRLTLRVVPERIEIRPGALTLRAGETAPLTAVALDADLKPIPNVRFQWESSQPAVATVNAAGVVSAAAAGTTTLTALLDAPMGGAGYAATAQATVFRRPDLRLTALASTADLQAGVTIKSILSVSVASDSVYGVVAALSNGGQAAIVVENNVPRVVAATGQNVLGQFLHYIEVMSVNSLGDAVLRANWVSEWGSADLVFFEKGKAPVRFGGWGRLHSRGLNDRKEIVWESGNTLYLRTPDGAITTLLDSTATVAGAGRVNSLCCSGPQLSNHGNVTTAMYSGTFNGYLFYDRATRAWRRIAAFGDALGAGSIQWMIEPVEDAPGVHFASVFFANQPGGIYRFSTGSPTAVVRGGETYGNVSIDWLHGHAPSSTRNGVTTFVGNANGADLLYRFDPQRGLEVLATLSRWTDILHLHATPQATVLACCFVKDNPNRLLRYAVGRDPAVALGNGTPLGVSLPPGTAWDLLPPLTAAAPFTFRAPGDAVMSAGGAPFGTGDALPGFAGRLVQFGPAAFAPNGDAAFVGQSTQNDVVLLRRNGQWKVIGDTAGGVTTSSGQRIDWVNRYYADPLAVNTRGQVVLRGSIGVPRLMMLTDGSPVVRILFDAEGAAPGGGSFAWQNNFFLDDTGRLFFRAGVSNGTIGVYVWENGSLRRILSTNDPHPMGGEGRVSGIYGLALAGDRLILRGDIGNPFSQNIWVWEGGRFTQALTQGSLLSGGQAYTGGAHVVAGAPNGDYAMVGYVDGFPAVILRKRDGRDLIAAWAAEPLEGTLFPTTPFRLSFGANGDLFLTVQTSVNGQERLTLYQAAP